MKHDSCQERPNINKIKAGSRRLGRKLLLDGIEVILDPKFGPGGVELLPRVRALKTLAELRGLLQCLVEAETLSPVAFHLSLTELLSR